VDPRYNLTELAALAGLTPRTVRYYLSQGLLAVDATPGPGPKYDDAHLARLRLIKRLQREHLPLAEIRGRLGDLDDQAVMALVSAPEPPPSDSAIDYVRRITAPRRMAIAEFLPPAPPSERPASPPASAPPPYPVTTTPSRLERSQWERIELAPDVELHVRRPLPRSVAKQVDRLIGIARDLLREES
jgi:DNA-binding transcriptional MerR regulator